MIVLDPGHGGKDSGAVNKDFNVLEKDINLAVGLLLRRYLNREGYTVLCTRTGDKFIPLKDRVSAVSTTDQAFVSIHANSRHRVGRNGLEVECYYSSKSYVSDPTLANFVLYGMVDWLETYVDIPIINRGVRDGNYYVLRNNRVPACLVELGFLSDPEEVKVLTDVAYQRILARGIGNGIISFLGRND